MQPSLVRAQLHAPLSAGEVHFVWWFIQGSIMDPGTRRHLRLGWGMCERHATGALAAEAAFRHGYLHGPAELYGDLMARAAQAFRVEGPLAAARLGRRLRSRRACLMCELGYGPRSRGFISAERLGAGRDPEPLRALLASLEPHWRGAVCGRCAGNGAPARCRPHLLEELGDGGGDALRLQHALVHDIDRHLARYCASFRWEMRGSDTAEDRAALISALGWCSGWTGLLALA